MLFARLLLGATLLYASVPVARAAFGLGQIIGPAFGGAVYDATGSFLAPSLTAAAALLTGAILVAGTARTATF